MAQQLIGGMVKENTALIDNFKNQFRTAWRDKMNKPFTTDPDSGNNIDIG